MNLPLLASRWGVFLAHPELGFAFLEPESTRASVPLLRLRFSWWNPLPSKIPRCIRIPSHRMHPSIKLPAHAFSPPSLGAAGCLRVGLLSASTSPKVRQPTPPESYRSNIIHLGDWQRPQNIQCPAREFVFKRVPTGVQKCPRNFNFLQPSKGKPPWLKLTPNLWSVIPTTTLSL